MRFFSFLILLALGGAVGLFAYQNQAEVIVQPVSERVGMPDRPTGLRAKKFELERNRDAARNLVLEGEEIRRAAVEVLLPTNARRPRHQSVGC